MLKSNAKDRMVTAAFELFVERGFDRTTVDEIVERAGVGRTTFFRKFATKEDVIFPDHDEIISRVQSRLDASSHETALFAIEDASRIVLQHYLEEGPIARGRYKLTSSVPALRAREIASAQQYRLVFKRYILGWLGNVAGAELRADLMAAAVVAAHNHVLRRWLRGETSEPLVEFEHAMAEVSALYGRHPDGGGTEAIVVLRTDQDMADLLARIRSAIAAH